MNFKQIFLHEDRVHRGLVLLFCVVCLLLAANALLHHPEIGYDANDHLLYMQTLPEKLPTDEDTREFFSPPLPYLIPALIDEACLRLNESALAEKDCRYFGGKSGQLINLLLGVGTVLLILYIAELWRPGDVQFRLSSIFFLGALPVFYKTFAQFWGQPYVVFFSTLAVWQFLRAIRLKESISWKTGVGMGVTLGLLVLSRQWGFLVIASILAFTALLLLVNKERVFQTQLIRMVSVALGVSFLVGSWFYFYLYATTGSFTAFARDSEGFSLANKEMTFYRNTGFKDLKLFKTPVRDHFSNMFIPIFYSEIWGDYWGYYTLLNRTDQVLAIWDWEHADYETAVAYLGRVNAASLILAALFGSGIVFGFWRLWRLLQQRDTAQTDAYAAFVALLVLISIVGYLWFVISYPSRTGDTIKATYMAHLFIVLPLLVSDFLKVLRARSTWAFSFIVLVSTLVVVHNLPAMLTRYIYIR